MSFMGSMHLHRTLSYYLGRTCRPGVRGSRRWGVPSSAWPGRGSGTPEQQLIASAVVFSGGPRGDGELIIERLAIADAAPEKLRPVGHIWNGIRRPRQEAPQVGLVPAEAVACAVSMPPNSFP